MKLKSRKNLFLLLMTIAAGGSMVTYGAMEGDFLTKTIQIVLLQQFVGAAIYFGCFGTSSSRSAAPFE
jgi:hypothetical protein